MKLRWLLAGVLLAGCGAPLAAGGNDNPPPNPKWFVCKYVDKPGEAERLQTGQNPISVSENAFPAGVTPAVGVQFNDAQGRSVIIAEDVGQPEPGVDACPNPNPPPPTSTSTTSTTTRPSTSAATTTSSSSTSSVPSSSSTTTQCEDCVINTVVAPSTSTTTTTGGPTTTATGATTTTATTSPSSTSSTTPGATTTTLPPTFDFAGATTVCVREVPTIRITFQNQFPSLAGRTGTLTMADVNGNVVSTQSLVYQPGQTVDILYPGTRVNPDGTIADVPGWNLTTDGFWVRDPSDEFLRAGINLTYTVNPTATAFVTYPPESSACANPSGPFPPGTPAPPGLPVVPTAPPPLSPSPSLPHTR